MQDEGIDASLQKLIAHKGVLGYSVLTPDGAPIRTTCDAATTALHAAAVPRLAAAARAMVRDLDPQVRALVWACSLPVCITSTFVIPQLMLSWVPPQEDLQYLRVRSSKHELMVATRK